MSFANKNNVSRLSFAILICFTCLLYHHQHYCQAFHTPHYALRILGGRRRRHGRLSSSLRTHHTTRTTTTTTTTTSSLQMRDHSMAYWFRVGDRVRVVEDVFKAQVNLNGYQGTVVETWEKCDVDPTCCCAEQVDLGLAVRVKFEGEEPGASDNKGENNNLFVTTHFEHYFAEDELSKMKVEEAAAEALVVPFDGMSCTAFKLEQLQSTQPRQIASFEPTTTTSPVDDE